uniref:Uncharacterized protein n=1 Tax=Rhodnius prolixus TaxID=13249 RepID=T1HVC3_RHOPR
MKENNTQSHVPQNCSPVVRLFSIISTTIIHSTDMARPANIDRVVHSQAVTKVLCAFRRKRRENGIYLEIMYSGEEIMYSGEEIMYSGEEIMYSGEEIMYSGEEIMYSGEEIMYSGEEIMYSGEEIMYSGEEIMYSGEEIMLFAMKRITTVVQDSYI